jgi:hypothetical protein
MKTIACVLLLLQSGCAWLDVSRIVHIRVHKTELPHSDGLTPNEAVQLLYDVANGHELKVTGPIHVKHAQAHYTATSVRKARNAPDLHLIIDEDYVSFICEITGSAKEFQAAEQMSKIIQHKLDEKGLKYGTAKRTGFPFAP